MFNYSNTKEVWYSDNKPFGSHLVFVPLKDRTIWRLDKGPPFEIQTSPVISSPHIQVIWCAKKLAAIKNRTWKVVSFFFHFFPRVRYLEATPRRRTFNEWGFVKVKLFLNVQNVAASNRIGPITVRSVSAASRRWITIALGKKILGSMLFKWHLDEGFKAEVTA